MELRRNRGFATFVTYPLKDASGNLVSGVTTLRPQYATFTDAAPISTISNIAGFCTELGATGIYYSSLSAAEMAHDYVYFIASPSTGSAKRLDILFNMTAIASVSVVASVSNPVPLLWSSITGVSASQILAGTVIASVNYPVALNWASISGTGSAQTLASTVIASVNYPVPLNWASISGMGAFATLTGTSIASVTNPVFPNWAQIANPTSVVSLTNTTIATATHVEDLTSTTYPEPAAVPAATATLKNKLNFLQVLARNKVQISSVTQVVFDDAEASTVTFATHTDAAGLFTKHEWR